MVLLNGDTPELFLLQDPSALPVGADEACGINVTVVVDAHDHALIRPGLFERVENDGNHLLVYSLDAVIPRRVSHARGIHAVSALVQNVNIDGGVIVLSERDIRVYAVAFIRVFQPLNGGNTPVHLAADVFELCLHLVGKEFPQKRRLKHPGQNKDKRSECQKTDPQYEIDAAKPLSLHASNLYPMPRRVTMNFLYSFKLLRSILMCVSTVRSSP